MCDGEGFMGHTEKAQRMAAADNHRKWVDITAELVGHAIRTNMYPGEKQPTTAAGIDDFVSRCVDSFSALCEYAKGRNISVLIENHGGVSFKCHEFDARSNETTIDMDPDDGNRGRGWAGIEFEGAQAAKRYLNKWPA